eukprot:gnl/TRDRNA2_/TRDRNA2_156324_c0_seq4.p1 gnl/TRDRNA2_/TRDRNA2_156324_c0~~gnl/TRDRNA2_/TRDRNA2_156324_c0_seq4.p1  ORF type:complete len:275 (+),score=44.53 gnl/TRDRNA2_/TRDRNA2_156324_c0_seq4:164-988(+)
MLEAAIAVISERGVHADDHAKLMEQKQQILDRIGLLKSSLDVSSTDVDSTAESSPAPVRHRMIHKAESLARSAKAMSAGKGSMAACAALSGGAAGGMLIVGTGLAIPMVVAGGLAGAAVGAHCATRKDKIGDAARKVGDTAVGGCERAASEAGRVYTSATAMQHKEKIAARLAQARAAAVAAQERAREIKAAQTQSMSQLDGRMAFREKVTGVSARLGAVKLQAQRVMTRKSAAASEGGASSLQPETSPDQARDILWARISEAGARATQPSSPK